jgi:hypothetical protein
MDERGYAVLFRETIDQTAFMLFNAAVKICGDADVKRAVFPAGEI